MIESHEIPFAWVFNPKNVRFNNDIRHSAQFQVLGDGLTLDESEALRSHSIFADVETEKPPAFLCRSKGVTP